MSNIGQPLEIVHGASPLASVIWLHGLGADGYDFQPIVPQLRLPQELSVRFIFPHAPSRPVTLNGGLAMPAWYDIFSLQEGARVDVDGLRQSAEFIHGLIQSEIKRGVPEHKIILAGFSQGGAVVLYYLTHFCANLAGVLALSTYLPIVETVIESIPGSECINQSIPVWMGHGQHDPVVQYRWGRHGAKQLEKLGFKVEWHEYAMPHSVSPEEIDEIGKWLVLRLSD